MPDRLLLNLGQICFKVTQCYIVLMPHYISVSDKIREMHFQTVNYIQLQRFYVAFFCILFCNKT
jgi:hypothetical protein